MVQFPPRADRKSRIDRNIYDGQYCEKLFVAQIFQLPSHERIVMMGYVLFALVAYFAPFIYFLLSGSDMAVVIWLLVSISILFMVF